MSPKTAKSSTGLDENVAGFLSYLLGFITGFVFYWSEEKSKFVRFHALQSIITFIPVALVLWIFGWVPVFGMLLKVLAAMLWVFLMVRAYSGQACKVPLVGNIAEDVAKKWAKSQAAEKPEKS